MIQVNNRNKYLKKYEFIKKESVITLYDLVKKKGFT